MYNLNKIIYIVVGMGLGKNEDGLPRPITVFIKKDTVGLGYNPNWWETLYDSTIKRIPVAHSKVVRQILYYDLNCVVLCIYEV